MDTRKLEWLKGSSSSSLSQIYSQGFSYAWANRTNQLSRFVYCKDFLHDCVYAHLHNKKVAIYGFNYDGSKTEHNLKRTWLLIANSHDPKFGSKMPALQEFLNQLEKDLKIKRTKIFQCENPPKEHGNGGVFLLRGSKIWINSAPLLSLYSMMLRVGMCHKIGSTYRETVKSVKDGTVANYQTKDRYYLQQSWSFIEKFIALGYRKFFYKDTKKNYPEGTAISNLHNSFGIIGYLQTLSAKETGYGVNSIYPNYWLRKSLDKKLKEVPKTA